MPDIRILTEGDSSVLVEFGKEISPEINRKITATVQLMKEQHIEGVVDMIPAFCSLLVNYDPRVISYDDLKKRLEILLKMEVTAGEGCRKVYEIPVCYGGEYGPDIENIAEHAGLSVEEVIKIHSSRDYLIYMLGFLPGFCYLGGLVLQGSWVPNEVTEATESDDSWGFFPWPAVKAGTDGTEGVMVGAQGFGVTKDSQMKQEAFDFAYSICTGETDMKMTDAVNSIPADTDNTQWPEVLADAVPYMKEMSKPYMWAAGLEADPDYKEQIQSELLKLTRLEETSDEFIENLSNMK